jgi:uncharacterized protein (DUF4415 family)
MKKKMVTYQYDPENPPALTSAQKAELEKLVSMPDSDIDFSDIPPLDERFWKNAVKNPFYRPKKTSTTVRIDSDVLYWLRTNGKGYQSRINAILRQAMLTSLNKRSA